MKSILLILTILLSFTALAQKKWHPYLGVHVSMNADGYYVGPSAQVGVNYRINQKISLSSYVHYFAKKVAEAYPNGTFQNGNYKSMIVCLLVETNFYRKDNKGIIVAGGLAVHSSIDDYTASYFYEEHNKRMILVAAARIGYSLPIKKRSIVFELNAVGPYVSDTGPAPYFYKEIEILTQLSLGMRFIF
jgi:hypothetical protein